MSKNKSVVCADGFRISVQANEGAYCTPRIDDAESYTHAEVGYPNMIEPLLMRYCEDPTKPCETVYGFVPKEIIIISILNHGGMVEGELPNGFGCISAFSKDNLNKSKR